MDGPKTQRYRHELKYMISSAQAAVLRKRLEHLMRPDPHAGPDGCYSVRSLYLDDYDNRCFYENESGVDPREKYRIRTYNHSSERIILERKRKERNMTQKTACLLTLGAAQKIAGGKAIAPEKGQPPLLYLMAVHMQLRRFRPAVIVEYDRAPFIYPLGNVRATLDANISSSVSFDRFFEEKIPKRPIMPTGQQFLEVKFDEFLPDHRYRSLQLDNLQRTAYSKFYYCRKFRAG